MTKTVEQLILEWLFFLFSTFICGFAQGTISFTASPVIVPLLLGLLNFDLISSLFISVMVDLANSVILSFIYGTHKRVIVFSGICFGMLQLPMEILIPLLTRHILVQYTNILRGNIPFLPLFLGSFFMIRGLVKFIRKKFSKKISNDENDDILETLIDETDENEESTQDNFLMKKLKQTKNFIREELKEERIYPEIEPPKTDGMYENLIYKIRGNAGEDLLFLENLPYKPLRILIFSIAIFINSCTNGLLYKSGGFGVNMLIHFLFRQKHSVSTGTACFISLFGVAGLAFSFIGREEILDYRLISHLIVGIVASSFGAVCGANWVLYFSDILVYLMIGFTMLLIGGISILQNYL